MGEESRKMRVGREMNGEMRAGRKMRAGGDESLEGVESETRAGR